MKKIKFILQNEDEISIEKILEYEKENEYLIFDIDKYKFKLKHSENDFDFIRETDEDIFKLSNVNENKGIITIKNPHNMFDIPIDRIDYVCGNDEISINYKIVDDNINRVIKITFINE